MAGFLNDLGSLLGSIPGSLAGGMIQGAGANVPMPLTPEQQQAFVNSLMAQQGNQAALVGQLQQQALGAGPNPAQQMLQQATGRNIAQQTGMIASQKGINPALAQRQAAQNAAMLSQQAAGQGAVMGAQQQLAAQQQLQNALSSQAQTGLYGAQLNQQAAMQNAQLRGRAAGEMMQGMGSAAALLAASKGGYVPGKAQVHGDSLANDNVPAMLSPGEIVIPRSVLNSKNPGVAAKEFVEKTLGQSKKKDSLNYAEGGAVDFVGPDILGQTQSSLSQQMPTAQPADPFAAYNKLVEMNPANPTKVNELAQQYNVPIPPSLGERVAKFIGEKRAEAQTAEQQKLAELGLQKPTDLQQPQLEQPQASSYQPVTQMPQQSMQDIYGYGATLEALRGGLGKQAAGLQAEAAATGALGKEQARIYEQQAMDQAFRQQLYEKNVASTMEDIKATTDALQKEKIDPGHYLGSMSTAGKLSTIAGLILGGMGAGLSGRGNQALELVNAQIGRDIDAQKANIGKKVTLLEANYKKLGSMREAEVMTRLQMQDQFANQLKLEAAKAQDPIAKARAMQEAGKLEAANASAIGTMEARKALMGSTAGTPEMKIRAFVPENQQKEYYKELQDMQNTVRSKDSVLGAFEKLNQINTVGGRMLSPLQTARQVDAIKKPITAMLSKETAGRFTEQDAAMLDSIWPMVGDSQQVIAEKRQRLNNLITDKMNFPMLKPLGITPEGLSRFGAGGEKRFQLGPAVK